MGLCAGWLVRIAIVTNKLKGISVAVKTKGHSNKEHLSSLPKEIVSKNVVRFDDILYIYLFLVLNHSNIQENPNKKDIAYLSD